MKLKYKKIVKGGNPYLPLWEHVPDGEPRVFEYNGEKRVYIYGSHDTLRSEYCGLDYVVWSAPVTDLTDWKCHGICFKSADGKPLYAPDVVQRGDTYYMYVAIDNGDKVIVAESKIPSGPFVNPRLTGLKFDPAVLIDDDGRIYAYWGFCQSCACELEEDMATIKEGSLVTHMIPNCDGSQWGFNTNCMDTDFSFFEASSIRKVDNKYIFIYSKRRDTDDPSHGLVKGTNCYLDYCYSDSPLHGWIHGGTISNNSGAMITAADGTNFRAYPSGNNHGSIVEINGQWYVFYHRMIGGNEFSRQAMLDPIDVSVSKDGKVYIGKVDYDKTGNPISCEETEMTSQGGALNGLNAYDIIPAGLACHLVSGTDKVQKHATDNIGPYIKPVYDGEQIAPICRITNGSTVGFKYIQLGDETPKTVSLKIKPENKSAYVVMYIGTYNGVEAARIKLDSEVTTAKLTTPITGKQAVYFTFISNDENEICEFEWFTFDK